MANVIFNNAKRLIGSGGFDWDDGAQTFRLALCTPVFVPDQDADIFVADISNELAGGGYARQNVINRTSAVDNALNRADYLADNVSFLALTSVQTVGWAVLYRFLTNDADSVLIAALEVTPNVDLTGLTTWLPLFDNQPANGAVFRVS